MTPHHDDDRRMLESLQDAVREALERKRRLGQYAVVWRDGRPVFIGPNPPAGSNRYPASSAKPVGGVAEPDSGEA